MKQSDIDELLKKRTDFDNTKNEAYLHLKLAFELILIALNQYGVEEKLCSEAEELRAFIKKVNSWKLQ